MFDTIAMLESPTQWIIILLIVLVLFGGSRIKDIMGGLGSGMKEFKNAMKEEDEEKSSKPEPKEPASKP